LPTGTNFHTMMSVNKSKVRVSVLVQNTQGIMALFCLVMIGLIGGVYLFMLNHMAFRGYVLQKEVESQKSLETQLSTLETKIAKIEAQEYLNKSRTIKNFATYQKPHFFVQKNSFTAQKLMKDQQPAEL
jgi:hypothetical protein